MAQVDYFLKITGIAGESMDIEHKGQIDIESWSWGETNAATFAVGGGGGAGKVHMRDFHFVAKVSKASPRLLLACASGEHLQEAILHCRKAGSKQHEYLTIRLRDCLVSSFSMGGSGHGDVLPTDQFSLAFSRIVAEYKEQRPTGTLGPSVTAGWDVKENRSV